MSEKERILVSLREEFDRWEDLLSSMSEAQINEPRLPANLSVKDVVAHLWAWQQRTVARLEAALSKTKPQYPAWPEGLDPYSEDDLEAINAWIHATNRDKPWSKVHHDWKTQYLHVIELGEEVPEQDLLQTGKYPWLADYALAAILAATYDHHHIEHLEPLLAFLSIKPGE